MIFEHLVFKVVQYSLSNLVFKLNFYRLMFNLPWFIPWFIPLLIFVIHFYFVLLFVNSLNSQLSEIINVCQSRSKLSKLTFWSCSSTEKECYRSWEFTNINIKFDEKLIPIVIWYFFENAEKMFNKYGILWSSRICLLKSDRSRQHCKSILDSTQEWSDWKL